MLIMLYMSGANHTALPDGQERLLMTVPTPNVFARPANTSAAFDAPVVPLDLGASPTIAPALAPPPAPSGEMPRLPHAS